MDVGDWTDILKTVGPILGVIGIVAAGLRIAWKWIKNCYKEVQYMFQQRAVHDALNEKIDAILDELKPNGGNSIKDTITRIDKQVEFFGSFRRAQLNTSPNALLETDAKGRVLWVNPAMIRLTGRPAAELLGSGWVNIIAPSVRRDVEENWEHTVEEGRMLDEEQTYITPDGQEFRVHVIAHPIKSADDELLGYLAEIHRQ